MMQFSIGSSITICSVSHKMKSNVADVAQRVAGVSSTPLGMVSSSAHTYRGGCSIFERIGGYLQQLLAVDVHEVSTMSGSWHSTAASSSAMPAWMCWRRSVDAVVGPRPGHARIRVGNKRALEKLMGIIEIKVMNDAVAEHAANTFALLGIVNDESIWKARPLYCLESRSSHKLLHVPSGSSSISARRHLHLMPGSVVERYI